jgi:hypothetical protein
MTTLIESAAADARYRAEETRFSVCTLVTDWDQYRAMLETFRTRGFVAPNTEFLHLDNSRGNRFEGFAGVNLFLGTARGRYIVLCHQDVRLVDDGSDALEARIAELERLDPDWAVLGNAGGLAPSRLFIRISDPHGADTTRGPFPARVSGLDENFLVVRREANLAVSRDIGGFHLYATDLCLVADVLGWSSYVIDFHLEHLSPGKTDASFKDVRTRLLAKWRRALRSRWVVSPSASLYLAARGAAALLMNSGFGRKLARRFGERSPSGPA